MYLLYFYVTATNYSQTTIYVYWPEVIQATEPQQKHKY